MIRTKVPERHGDGGADAPPGRDRRPNSAAGEAHLTTRQNVQYHFVPLRQVPDVLHKLADVRLTTREACYNTVRNVTACPVAGIAADEAFDVRPYARRVAFAFLHKTLTDNMPRKFKIAFSGCKDDCIATSINDLGFRAVVRYEDGVERRGFRVTVGGGLGTAADRVAAAGGFLARRSRGESVRGGHARLQCPRQSSATKTRPG